MSTTFNNILSIIPLIALLVGYHKYLADELQKKVDTETFKRERDIQREWQLKSGDNLLAILNRIENRLEHIEQKLMK